MTRAYKVEGQASLDTKNFDVGVGKVHEGFRKVQADADRTASRWSGMMGGLAGKLSLAGTASFAAMSIGIGKLVDRGSQLNDLSNQLGMTTNAISELTYAAGMSGVEFDKVASGIQKMQKNLGGGGKEVDSVLKTLGLDPRAIKAAAPDEAFTAIIDALGKVKSQNTRMDLVQKIFGRGGGEFLRLAKDGAQALAALRQEARDFGLSMDPGTASNWDNVGDAFDRLKGAGAGLWETIGKDLAPALADLLGKVTGGIATVQDFADAHPTLTKNAGEAAIALGAVASAITSIGLAVKGVGAIKGLLGLGEIAAGAAGAGAAGSAAAGGAGTAAAAGAAGVGLGTAGLAIAGGGLAGAYAGGKAFDAGWANEGAGPLGIGGAIFGGIGRSRLGQAVGDWWVGQSNVQLGERSQQMMTRDVPSPVAPPARTQPQPPAGGGGSSREDTALMQRQNKLLEQQNKFLEKIAANTRGAAGISRMNTLMN